MKNTDLKMEAECPHPAKLRPRSTWFRARRQFGVGVPRLHSLIKFGANLAWAMMCFISARAFAATYVVDSLSALQSHIDTASAGDLITVKNGTYTANVAVSITCAGTTERPITISAEQVGGAEIRGAAGFKFVSPATNVVVKGFVFTHASGQASIGVATSHCRLSRCVFECPGEGAYLTVSGDDVELDRNEFRRKHTLGNMLSVTGQGSQVARRLWVHHNYFHDFANAHGNGGETIRFGLSGLSMSTGEGLGEYNLFVRCVGENELISNKSCGNTYRYNSFLDSPGAELSQRHGNHCLIYGNYFRHTQGIRIFGDDHLIFSNYLEDNSVAITIGNGDGEVADGAKLTSHDRPDRCTIAFNTLVNNATNFQMAGRSHGLGATHTTFANNIIQGGGKAAVIATGASYTGAVWSGNLLWKTAGAGDLPADGFITAAPLLVADAAGVFHLQRGSPAIDSAVGHFPGVDFDMDGQPRLDPKDKGADEFSNEPVTVQILKTDEVGPGSAP